MSLRNHRRLRFALLAVLLAAGAAWIVPSYFSAERYRHRLEAGLERALHRRVKFGAVAFRLIPRPGFSIENAEVEEDPDFGLEPFARVDRIECDLRWQSLWHSRKDFSRLRLERPSLNLVLNRQGEWNAGRLLRQSGVAAPASSADGTILNTGEPLDLEAEDTRVDFKVGVNKIPFALTDAKARLHFNPARGLVEFNVVASPVRPDLSMPTPGPVEAEGSWTPGRDLQGPLDARVRLRGALLYDWLPILTGHNPEVYGVVDTDAHLSGSVLKLTVEGESRLTQLQRWGELSSADPLPCTFRFRSHLLADQQRVLMENLEASFADSHLHVSGSIDHLWSTPQLDLVAALERSRLEDFEVVVRRLWPGPSVVTLKGRVDGMLTLQGPWNERKYGGFVGARGVSLETASGSFPVSDLAVHITNRGARLAPARITLSPHVAVTAEGAIERRDATPSYDLQIAAKGIPLRDALALGRGLGIRTFQGLDATGSAAGTVRFSGAAWPWTPPTVSAHGQLRAARLLIPGLTEPLNIPHASFEARDSQVTVEPLVAVLGTSIFNAKLGHHGAWSQPWQFEVHANALSLEQGALWFDALGHRRPLPLLQRLPELANFAARRDAASQRFGRLNAVGEFATPKLTYRGIVLQDFKSRIEIAQRTVRIKKATFRAGGGHGESSGLADFSSMPVRLTADVSLAGLAAEPLASHLLVSLPRLRGAANANAHFETSGLARDDLARNLTGKVTLHSRELSLGDFDPLQILAHEGHWGTLEPSRNSVTARSVMLSLSLANRRLALDNATVELGGATLQLSGTYALGGNLNLDVRADLRRLRRRWLVREDLPRPGAASAAVHLTGSLEKPTIVPQVEASRVRE